jgi:hypothetical protein
VYLEFAVINRLSISNLARNTKDTLAKLNRAKQDDTVNQELAKMAQEEADLIAIMSSDKGKESYHEDSFVEPVFRPFVWYRTHATTLLMLKRDIPIAGWEATVHPGTSLIAVTNPETTDMCLLFESDKGFACEGNVTFWVTKSDLPASKEILQGCETDLANLSVEQQGLRLKKEKAISEAAEELEKDLSVISATYDAVSEQMASREASDRYRSLARIVRALWPNEPGPARSDLEPAAASSFIQSLDRLREFEQNNNPPKRDLQVEEVVVFLGATRRWNDVKDGIL